MTSDAPPARRGDDCTLSTSGRGRRGEDEALAWLEAQGYQLVARNVRSSRGEIDLVMTQGQLLVFVEVKAWKTWGAAELERVVGPIKQRRICETAKFFLAQHREYNGMAYRFDVLLIASSGIRHLAHAFMERV